MHSTALASLFDNVTPPQADERPNAVIAGSAAVVRMLMAAEYFKSCGELPEWAK